MYSLSEKIDHLKKCSLFETLSHDELKFIAISSTFIKCRANEVLFRENDESSDAYIVLEGEAEALTEPENLKPVSLAKFEKNSIFGEFAVIANIPRTATVKITKDMTALILSRHTFLNLLRVFPDLSLKIMTILVNKLLVTQNRFIKSIIQKDTLDLDGSDVFHV